MKSWVNSHTIPHHACIIIFNTPALTVQGHARSNVTMVLDSTYMISYQVFNSNTWRNSINLHNLSDLDNDIVLLRSDVIILLDTTFMVSN